MSRIQISNLTFSYPGSSKDIFKDVTFQMDTDWKLGFIGRNGRGKTTFMKLLTGELIDYSGNINHNVLFDYFPVAITDRSAAVIDLIETHCPQVMQWEIEREFSLLNLSDDLLGRSFETLSGGEACKVQLIMLFLNQNHFLLIDEPTNHLDREGRAVVSRYLNQKKGFILVSHDRHFLDDCVDHILSINRMNIEIVQGNFSSWQHNKALQDQFEYRQNVKLKREITTLTVAQKRTKNWSDKVESSKIGDHAIDRGAIGAQSARMMKRSKSIERRINRSIEEKESLLKNIESADPLELFPQLYRSEKLLELLDVFLSYAGKPILQGVTFTLRAGERVAISGANGSGKTSLLKLLSGHIKPESGAYHMPNDLLISYVSQKTDDLCGSLKDYAENNKISESLLKSMLSKLDFDALQFERPLDQLSEGQKKKVLLARSICERAHIYLWDEPLNFVDVISRIQLEEMILKSMPTMIFIEHDRTFTDSVATRVVHLTPHVSK